MVRATLPHQGALHPRLVSQRTATTLGFMRRAMRFGRLSRNLTQLHARGTYVPTPGPSARQATVKVWQAHAGTTPSHLRYLAHGKGVDGQDAEVFTHHGDALHAPAFASRVRDDPHQWRMEVSPEDAKDLDLKAYALAYIGQVERDLGTTLDWAGAVHHDTAHPHIHYIISGMDDHNEPLYLQKHYLTHGLRHRAQTMAETLGVSREGLGHEQPATIHHTEYPTAAFLGDDLLETHLTGRAETVGTDRQGAIEERALGPRAQVEQRRLSRAEVEARMQESLAQAQRIRDRMRPRAHGYER